MYCFHILRYSQQCVSEEGVKCHMKPQLHEQANSSHEFMEVVLARPINGG